MLRDRDIPTPQEALLREAITEVDTILTKRFSPRAPGARRDTCNIAASHMKIIGEKFGSRIQIVSAWELHKVFSGESARFDHVFDHTLTIAPEQRTLVDPTFCQFLHRDTPEIYADEGYPSGRLNESPVAIGLLAEGLVELTDENLRDYLRITTTASDKGYVESATVDRLLSESTLL